LFVRVCLVARLATPTKSHPLMVDLISTKKVFPTLPTLCGLFCCAGEINLQKGIDKQARTMLSYAQQASTLEKREANNMTDNTYNGWKNRQTWNVALWINNDEPLYRAAVDYMKEKGHKSRKPYTNFIIREGLQYDRTPDNIAWLGTRLDYRALNEMMKELIS